MVSDEIGLKLHHLAITRQPLTLEDEEQGQLQAWHADKEQADKEQAEAAMFILDDQPLPDVATLQAQIGQALAQLAKNVQQLQTIMEENNAIRQGKGYLCLHCREAATIKNVGVSGLAGGEAQPEQTLAVSD
jgi:hypothetical protein